MNRYGENYFAARFGWQLVDAFVYTADDPPPRTTPMHDLTFEIVLRPHSPTEMLPWVRHHDGRLRRASAEEAALWAALVRATNEAEDEAAPERKGRKR